MLVVHVHHWFFAVPWSFFRNDTSQVSMHHPIVFIW